MTLHSIFASDQDRALVQVCVVVTALTAVLSVACKLVVEAPQLVTKSSGLLERAFYWRDLARSEDDLLLRYQHYATAVAFVRAAMEVHADLEHSAGVDVARECRRMQQAMAAVRDALKNVAGSSEYGRPKK
jgi:hypothetical protein